MEGFEKGIVLCGDHGAQEQRCAYGRTSTAGKALAAPLARLPCPRSKAGKACNLPAIELAEFRQFSQECSGDDVSDAGDSFQKVFLLTPGRRSTNRVVNILVECVELFFERLEKPGHALLQMPAWKMRFPLPFGHHHLDD